RSQPAVPPVSCNEAQRVVPRSTAAFAKRYGVVLATSPAPIRCAPGSHRRREVCTEHARRSVFEPAQALCAEVSLRAGAGRDGEPHAARGASRHPRGGDRTRIRRVRPALPRGTDRRSATAGDPFASALGTFMLGANRSDSSFERLIRAEKGGGE